MDFTNHPIKKQSTSISTENKLNIDVDIDKLTGIIREKVRDPFLGKAFIKKAASVLPEHQLYSIAEFAFREGAHPGRLFVSVCSKAMKDAA